MVKVLQDAVHAIFLSLGLLHPLSFVKQAILLERLDPSLLGLLGLQEVSCLNFLLKELLVVLELLVVVHLLFFLLLLGVLKSLFPR